MDINTSGFSYQLLNIRIEPPDRTDTPADSNRTQHSAENINRTLYRQQATSTTNNHADQTNNVNLEKIKTSQPSFQAQGLIITQQKDIASATFQQITDIGAETGHIIDTYA